MKELVSDVGQSFLLWGAITAVVATLLIYGLSLMWSGLPTLLALVMAFPAVYLTAHGFGWYAGELVTRRAASRWAISTDGGRWPYLPHVVVGWVVIAAIVIFS